MTVPEGLESSNGHGSAVFQNAVCLLVELRRLGTRRKVSSGSVETDADRDFLHVSKDILQSKELEAVARFDGDIRRYLGARCLPSLFKGGIYLLPLALVEEVDRFLSQAQIDRAILVERFVEVYEGQAEAARVKLGTLYNPRDYPAADAVRAAFDLRVQYVSFDTPATLQRIRADIFAREQEKAAAQWSEALDECRGVLRAAMADLVDHMVERLQPGPGGKSRIFRDSLVGNLDEFLGTFQARNIADDSELAAVVEQARAALHGVTPDGLRSSTFTRDRVREQFEGIKSTLDTMLVNRPARRIAADVEE